MTKAFISGCAGTALSSKELDFFSKEDPWGLILFRRNCVDREQVRSLIAAFRECVGRADAPVLIDQEGGRVQRLRPPHWPNYPAGRVFGALYEKDQAAGELAAWLGARLIAEDLREIGVSVDCLPLLDVSRPETVDAIGDRAYASDPATVSILGRKVCEGLLAGGVLPVIKHLPGHGRAQVDSHLSLPRVDASEEELEQSDLVPFRDLADMPLAMTAHLLFSKIDPEQPATQSSTIIRDLIRSKIGFAGALMSDDLSMQALGGSLGNRGEKAFAAGCDLVLHCNGDMSEMLEVAAVSPALTGLAAERCARALVTGNAALEAANAGEFSAEDASLELNALLAHGQA